MRILLCLVFVSLHYLAVQSQSLADTSHQMDAWYQEAQVLIEKYQFNEALKPLTSCYHYDNKNIDYLSKIAYCHQQLGRYTDAKIYYNEVLKWDSLHVRSIMALANISNREANYGKALDYYQQLLAVDSTNSYYFKQAAFTALRKNDVLQAVRYFLAAHQLNHEDLEVLDQLSDIYIALRDLESAERMVNKGLFLDQKNIKLLYNKARIHQKRKEYAEVVKAVNQVMVQGDTADYYQTILGVAYIKLDSLDQGIFHLEKIVGRDKADDRVFHYLGTAYFQKEDYKKSETNYLLAIEAGVSPQMPSYHGDLGLLYDKQKQLRKAIKHYKQALYYDRTPEYLFHLAHSSDQYYKDKKIGFQLYKEYLASGHKKYRKFTTQRVEALKEYLHFQTGSQ